MKPGSVTSWRAELRRALSHEVPVDRVGGATRQTPREDLKLLQPYLLRHWRRGALGATLIISGSLLVLPQPLITRFFVDDVLLARRLDLLVVAGALFAAVKLLAMALGPAQSYVMTRFEQDVILDLQADLLERTLRLPKAFFDEKETGYLMSRLSSDVQGLRWFFSGTLVTLATNTLQLVGGFVFLFILEWRLGLATLVTIPVLPFVVTWFGRRFRALSHRGMEHQAGVTRRLEETLAASTLVKSFGTERREAGRIVNELKAVRGVTMEQAVLGSAATLAINAVPNLSRGLVVIIGAVLVIRGEWTLGSLMAFLSYLGYVYGPALSVASMNQQLQYALAALDRVAALFRAIPEENVGTGERVESLRGEIDVRDVSFSYGGEPVFEDVTFRVEPGQLVAIVGPSGVGKTTLVSLLLQLYRPTRGEIRFDGKPASACELGSLRNRIGYVSQNAVLLSGTILDNLRYGKTEASQEEAIGAAKVAGIHDFIEALPGGYATLVGERGVNLSEGQKQRLSLARALLKDPDVLILDEPTAALDGVVERSILDALPARLRGKTCIVVSHRLATVERADRVLLLQSRRLAAEGTHGELLETSSTYRDLVSGGRSG